MTFSPDPRLRTPLQTVDGAQFKHLLSGAVAMLEQTYQQVNKLNVFPVPDGDTGTNMLMTARNAWKFVQELPADAEFGTVALHFARGAIRGSRGNSGTILSEMLRGFASEVSGSRTLDYETLCRAIAAAVTMAYSVVEKPVEGTILTVAREISEEVQGADAGAGDLLDLLRRIVERAKRAVLDTPDYLPILRKAGVVDSGAQGLAYFFEGMYRVALGEPLEITGGALEHATVLLSEVLQAEDPQGYAYDVQFLLEGQALKLAQIRADISAMGDSMVVLGDETLVKVHIHVHDPGVPLSYGVRLGTIHDVVVENMQLQANEYIAGRESAAIEPMQMDGNAVVTVVPGEGLARLFLSFVGTRVVSGGDTMNPSSSDLTDAIRALDAACVFILPNNRNIILTAEQAAREFPEKQVRIIPTRSVPQGIAAMLAFNTDGDPDAVAAKMNEARQGVLSAEITSASRAIELEGVQVQEGNIIGLLEGKLIAGGAQIVEVVRAVLHSAIQPQHELVTLYFGADQTQADVDALIAALGAEFSSVEFDSVAGGQPHYFYLMSIE